MDGVVCPSYLRSSLPPLSSSSSFGASFLGAHLAAREPPSARIEVKSSSFFLSLSLSLYIYIFNLYIFDFQRTECMRERYEGWEGEREVGGDDGERWRYERGEVGARREDKRRRKEARGVNGGINHGFIRRRSPEIARLQYYTPRTGGWWEWKMPGERRRAAPCEGAGRRGLEGAPVVKPTLRDVGDAPSNRPTPWLQQPPEPGPFLFWGWQFAVISPTTR